MMIFIPFYPQFTRKLSILILALCIFIAFKNQHVDPDKASKITSETTTPLLTKPLYWSTKNRNIDVGNDAPQHPLEYDFYRESCPLAETIVRAIVRELYRMGTDVAPALLRLVFHDCFIEGCDASILLDSDDGVRSEKDAPPNESLKGYDIIDVIKSELEEVCPGVVSCADIIVLAAREAVLLAGGPFYPLHTGRRDSTVAYYDVAAYELPSPHGDLDETLASFASKGFDERETVSLLGAHSIGQVHCKFFQSRLYNFGGTNDADPSLNVDFLDELRSKCNKSRVSASLALSPSSHVAPSSTAASPSVNNLSPASASLALSPSSHVSPLSTAASPSVDNLSPSTPDGPAMQLSLDGIEPDFGTLYYRSLLQGKGLLYSDQQLMAGEETGIWVRAYASDASLFRRDFAQVMMKLSNIRVLTAPLGQIRQHCAKVVR